MDDRPEEPRHDPVPVALRIGVAAAVAVMILLGAIRWLNTSSVFPNWIAQGGDAIEIAASRDDVREVRVPTPDGLELYGWVQGRERALRRVIRFGGNAECIGPGADRCADHAEALGAQFLIVDYRGYGQSPGRPSETGLYQDARGAYRFAVDELGWRPEEIVLWGRSLGAAVAIKLAHELHGDGRGEFPAGGAPPRALILEAPFSSIPDMAQSAMGHLLIPHWLVYNLFDNTARAGDIDVPVFQFHGDADDVVPFTQGESLHEVFAGPKRFHAVEGAAHNDVWIDQARGDELHRQIDAFLEAHP